MSEEEPPRVMSASVSDFRYLAALLRGVNFANRACLSITSDGFTVSVEEARSLTATAFIFKHIFDEFIYNPEVALGSQDSNGRRTQDDDEEVPTVFEIPLNTLVECLNLFGTASQAPTSSKKKNKKLTEDGADEDKIGGARSKDKGKGRADAADGNTRLDQWFSPGKGTGMRMSYTGPGHPLTLFVTDETGGPSATCEITTWEPEDRFELTFDAERTVLKIILKSSWLRDALSELESSTHKLTIIGNPPPPGNRSNARTAPPRLRLRAVGQFGITEMDYPNDREVLETCECPEAVSFTYKFSHIARALRALQSSLKTSLRIDDEGLLSLQFMMPSPRKTDEQERRSEAFVEVWCLPLEE